MRNAFLSIFILCLLCLHGNCQEANDNSILKEQKVVNLPFKVPDLVGTYETAYVPDKRLETPREDYHDTFNKLISKDVPPQGTSFAVVPSKDIPKGIEMYYPGRDNVKIQEDTERYRRNALLSKIGKTIFVLFLMGVTIYAYKLSRRKEGVAKSKKIVTEDDADNEIGNNKEIAKKGKNSKEIIHELERLQELLEKGAISTMEFTELKMKILNS